MPKIQKKKIGDCFQVDLTRVCQETLLKRVYLLCSTWPFNKTPSLAKALRLSKGSVQRSPFDKSLVGSSPE